MLVPIEHEAVFAAASVQFGPGESVSVNQDVRAGHGQTPADHLAQADSAQQVRQAGVVVSQHQFEGCGGAERFEQGSQEVLDHRGSRVAMDEVTEEDPAGGVVVRCQGLEALDRVIRDQREEGAALAFHPGVPEVQIGYQKSALERQPDGPAEVQDEAGGNSTGAKVERSGWRGSGAGGLTGARGRRWFARNANLAGIGGSGGRIRHRVSSG